MSAVGWEGDRHFLLKVSSTPHLRLNDCVVQRIKMLRYYRVRSAFNPRDALPLSPIWGAEATIKNVLMELTDALQ